MIERPQLLAQQSLEGVEVSVTRLQGFARDQNFYLVISIDHNAGQLPNYLGRYMTGQFVTVDPAHRCRCSFALAPTPSPQWVPAMRQVTQRTFRTAGALSPKIGQLSKQRAISIVNRKEFDV